MRIRNSLRSGLGLALVATLFLPALSIGGARPAAALGGELAKDEIARRNRSLARMLAESVPINRGLPVIESEAETRFPSAEEVTMRAVATLVVGMKGMGTPRAVIDKYVSDFGLTPWLSPEEKTFLAAPKPDDHIRMVHGWRVEASRVLFWSIGLVDRLDGPREQIEPAALTALLQKQSRAGLLAKAKLRPVSAVLDQVDLIYCYRWALVDENYHGRPAPAGLSDDIAMEWHQALNWLVRHDEEPWDDVSLDT